jgi:uncharacterized protein (TIGR03437 family)
VRDHTAIVEVEGRRSNPVLVPVRSMPLTIRSVLNAASFKQGLVAPGAIMTVYGWGFGNEDGFGLFPSTTFRQLSVTFNGQPAPLVHVVASKKQINVVAPNEIPRLPFNQDPFNRLVEVRIQNGAGVSAKFDVRRTDASLGLFTLSPPVQTSYRVVAARFSNRGWLVIPPSWAEKYNIPGDCRARGEAPLALCGEPARPGDAVDLYLTGLGVATADGTATGTRLPTGSVAPANGQPLYRTVGTAGVLIGGDNPVWANVLFSGMAPGFAGLYQVTFIMPENVPQGDWVPIEVRFGGSSDWATIAIRH